MKRLLSLLISLALALPALAGEAPLVIQSGQVRKLPAATALQLNAPTTASATITLPHGTAPTSPGDGDCWTTTAGLYCRINGATAGPYAAASSGVTSVAVSGGTTGLTTSGGPITTSGTITFAGTLNLANGGTGSATAAGARTNLGATTLGSNLFTQTNPSAVTFPRYNADNSVSALDAATFRSAIGAGTSSTSGTVTSVAALTLGTSGTDLSSSVATGTTTPVITLNVPTASASNRGALSAADWSTFNGKQAALGFTPVQQGTGTGQLSGNAVKIGWSSGSRLKATVDSTDLGNFVFEGNRPAFASTVGVGNVAGAASGAGVSFPATASLSTDPNTLDDYKEATWTPTVTALSGTITTASASGTYAKIGRVVIAHMVITITTNGTGATGIVATLPVASAVAAIGNGRVSTGTGEQLQVEASAGSSNATIVTYSNGYPGGSGRVIVVTLIYFA